MDAPPLFHFPYTSGKGSGTSKRGEKRGKGKKGKCGKKGKEKKTVATTKNNC